MLSSNRQITALVMGIALVAFATTAPGQWKTKAPAGKGVVLTSEVEGAKPSAEPEPEKEPVEMVPVERISPGDVIIINVREDAALLNNQYLVNSNGVVSFSYVGEVAAEGLTPAEFAEKIRTKLEAEYLQRATVSIEVRGQVRQIRGDGTPVAITPVIQSRGQVYVMGKVRNPGPVEIPPEDKNYTVSKAVIRAGVGDFAKISRTKLIRKRPDGKTDEILVNVYRIIYDGRLDLDVPVEKDDWIIVPEGWWQGPS